MATFALTAFPRMSRAAAVLVALLWATAAAAQQQPGLSDIVDAWLASPHGDFRSESFSHWDKEGAVPEACAACHAGFGMVDFLGADGSAAGRVDGPAPTQSPVGCAACHSGAAHALDSVTFPSGATATGLGSSAVCAVCHQGRQSGKAVAEATSGMDEDAVSESLGFLNVHYAAAAATQMGADAGGGYQYPGRDYAGRFAHAPGANSCADCHSPHSTEVEIAPCLSCHQGVTETAEIRARHRDFDGDGDRVEGIRGEIETLHRRLGEAIVAYAREVAGTPIGYAADSHPYFFADSDGDGRIGDAEAVRANSYKAWTPRLLKAAYNYHLVAKEPGAYVHNPAYALQLLHDSLESLAGHAGTDAAGIARP